MKGDISVLAGNSKLNSLVKSVNKFLPRVSAYFVRHTSYHDDKCDEVIIT